MESMNIFITGIFILSLTFWNTVIPATPETNHKHDLKRHLSSVAAHQSSPQTLSVNTGKLVQKPKYDKVERKLTEMLKSFFKIPPEVYFDTPGLVRSRGYAVETHQVTTQDGYILLLHRILGRPRPGPRPQPPDVALLVSSIYGSSSDFVHNEPNESLGYILADSGYDVWLGNLRGSLGGLNHTHLNADADPLFWSYSFDEIAQYDLPALVNFVLKHTGQQKLFFSTYSATTLAFFMSGGPSAGVMDKLRMAMLFAPVAYVRHPSAYIKLAARFMLTIQGIAEKVLWGPLIRDSDLLRSVIHVACRDGSPFRGLCVFVATTAFAGTNTGSYGKNGFSSMLASATSGTPLRSLVHLAQQAFAPGIQMYDYGSEATNRVRYGSPTPPLYNLSDVTAPVVICTAPNDGTMSEKDLQLLMRDLPRIVKRIVPSQRDFGHFDLVFSTTARELIYDELLKIMKQY